MSASLDPEFSPIEEMLAKRKPPVDTSSDVLGEPFELMVRGELSNRGETLAQILDYKVKRELETLPSENKKEVEIILDKEPRKGEIRALCQQWYNLYFEDNPVQIDNLNVESLQKNPNGKWILMVSFIESPYTPEPVN